MKLNEISPSRTTLGRIAYETIRNEIISLRVKPGQMIFESATARQLGVSRTPVREAFYMLQHEELLHIIPQRGARIALLSAADLQESQFIRESLELSVFAEVARSWDNSKSTYAQAKNKISHILAEQERVINEQDYIGYVSLDVRFHDAILELVNNKRLLAITGQLQAHLKRMRYLELQEARHEKESHQQHVEIFQAIQANDATRTQQLLKYHFHHLLNRWPAIIDKYHEYFIDP